MQTTTFYSRFGRILSITVLVMLTLALGVIVAADGIQSALLATPALLALLLLCWASFWNPRVVVDAAGVEFVNVFSSVKIPWGQIARIDTKYTLTLVTAGGSFGAWAAPAPGRHSVFRASREDGSHLPESTYLAGTVRPGDLTSSDSGAAAAIIRREWERLRDLGQLRAEGEIVRSVSWARLALVLVGFVLAALISF